MKAGSLKFRIKIIHSQLTTDAFGSKSENWIMYQEVRAGILYKSGNKNITDNEMFNSSSIDFIVRYDKFITEQMRINFNDKIYKIAALNKSPFDDTLTISTELIVGLSQTEIILTGNTWIQGGTSGTDGTSGTNGTSGSSGIDGLIGTSGTNGSSGSSGIDGSIGTSGQNGSSGSSGTSGLDGTASAAGSSGTSGTDGTSGQDGLTTSGQTHQTLYFETDTQILYTPNINVSGLTITYTGDTTNFNSVIVNKADGLLYSASGFGGSLGNIDGGNSTSIYGGTTNIDGGNSI